MIPMVATQPTETPTRSAASESAPEGMDFLTALQSLTEGVGTGAGQPVPALGAGMLPQSPDDAAPSVPADAASVEEGLAGAWPNGADQAFLCALLGQTAAEPPRRVSSEPAAIAQSTTSGTAQGQTVTSPRAPTEAALLSMIASQADAVEALGPQQQQAEAEAGSDARTSDANPAAGESPAPRAAAGVELQSSMVRMAPEAASRASPPPLPSTVGTPQWNQELAARVSWLVDRGDQSALIRLSPEQLGPVEVRLAVREGEASIWFGAAQADTRAAIEQAMPRLREMLAGMGLSLADAGVFQHAPPDPQRGFVQADARRAASERAPADAVETLVRYGRRGLIDDYA
jgi:flagellar hook-length control protein FliK